MKICACEIHAVITNKQTLHDELAESTLLPGVFVVNSNKLGGSRYFILVPIESLRMRLPISEYYNTNLILCHTISHI